MRSRSVSVAELGKNVGLYVERVRMGEEIVILDRRTPIARMVPLRAAGHLSAEEAALVAEGKLNPGTGALPRSFWKVRAPRIAHAELLAALDAVRHDWPP